MKDNEFELGEEEEEAEEDGEEENLSQRQQKRPIRHHVKRRSNGRVKMTRTNSNHSELGHSPENSSASRKRKSVITMTRVKDDNRPSKPLLPITSVSIAPPLEQTLNAVACHFVNRIPTTKKQLLFSQFISSDDVEFDIVNREYMCIKRYQDPMLTSLMRCTNSIPSTSSSSSSSSSFLNRKRYHHLKLVARAAHTTKQPTASKSLWKSFLKKFLCT